MRTLYLHVGWSKTGTSAIQKQVQNLRNTFLEKGILYPQNIQWNDYSHHPFALAFRGDISGYAKNISDLEAITILKRELNESKAESVLISSELSPFYFNNHNFTEFVSEYFDEVKIIFTVRRQSEFILSLFNQLIKDPNVRLADSFYGLTINNLPNMNYFQNIERWKNVVGEKNIIVVPYSNNIVNDFLNKFDIIFDSKQMNSNNSTVNESLSTRCLLMLQEQGKSLKTVREYNELKQNIILKDQAIKDIEKSVVLFSKEEQFYLDRYYTRTNQLIENNYLGGKKLFNDKKYEDILAFPPDFKL
jgi:hypothetical protein